MSNRPLTPLSEFDEAEDRHSQAAHDMADLLAATLHDQFPTGTYLVISLHQAPDGRTVASPDSVRDAQGVSVWTTPEEGYVDAAPLPRVSADIACLWGEHDPQEVGGLHELVARIAETFPVAPFACFDTLPPELRTAKEVEAEAKGKRMLWGIRLTPGPAQVQQPAPSNTAPGMTTEPRPDAASHGDGLAPSPLPRVITSISATVNGVDISIEEAVDEKLWKIMAESPFLREQHKLRLRSQLADAVVEHLNPRITAHRPTLPVPADPEE